MKRFLMLSAAVAVFAAPALLHPLHAFAATQIFLTSTTTTSWTVPLDWNSSDNTIEVIGAGGGGSGFQSDTGSGAGGGYSAISNATLTQGATVAYAIGSGGAGGAGGGGAAADGGDGGDTYFCSSTSNCASLSGTAVIVGAQGGEGGDAHSITTATGGAAASGVGTTKYSGGDGPGVTAGASGGGGAAGPYGDGGDGGLFDTTGAGASGAGGGGGGGGAAGGQNVSNSSAGAGGNNHAGSGGGASSAAGSDGGGGGGGLGTGTGTPGGTGGAGTEWDATHGSGGGGGGGGNSNPVAHQTTDSGGDGGLYGAGGGTGGGYGYSSGGNGAQGIIVITYTPLAPLSCTLSANPSGILRGGSSLLSWTTANATSTSIDNGVGSVATSSGSTAVSPVTDTVYTLSVTGNNQTTSCTATVYIAPAAQSQIIGGHTVVQGGSTVVK